MLNIKIDEVLSESWRGVFTPHNASVESLNIGAQGTEGGLARAEVNEDLFGWVCLPKTHISQAV